MEHKNQTDVSKVKARGGFCNAFVCWEFPIYAD